LEEGKNRGKTVEKQAFFDEPYPIAAGLPNRRDYPAEDFGKLSVLAMRSPVAE